MGFVITQTGSWAGQTLGLDFQTLVQTSGFLLSIQKLGRVFQKLGWEFQMIGSLFWEKCSAESFDQGTYS